MLMFDKSNSSVVRVKNNTVAELQQAARAIHTVRHGANAL
jgi:hypothetical protein